MPSPEVSRQEVFSQVPLSRRQLLTRLSALGIGTAGFQRALAFQAQGQSTVTPEMVTEAQWIAGIELDEMQRAELARGLSRLQDDARQLRAQNIDADVVPAIVFRPDFYYANAESEAEPPLAPGEEKLGASWQAERVTTVHADWSPVRVDELDDEGLAFASIAQQASLLSAGRISSRELTELYLARLKRYDPLLRCVILLLEDSALRQADQADARRSAGISRGVLDGIPWVAKDLIAVPPWETTWGAAPFQEQVRPRMATVAERLERAGCVLLAKVSLGALAWGDDWFGGKTRNPWDPEQGSSGSSAGSASAVAAGLASFALGSETLGSIISPCRRCRTCGLRGTYGRVSRAGCMPLAWSMDKIGPIARHAADLAYVFAALLGADGRDPSVVEREFQWPSTQSLASLRIGVAERLNDAEQQAVDCLQAAGARTQPFDLASELPVDALNFILDVEAGAMFDDAFRDDPHADFGRWPSTFRKAQFVPAIQYLQANRLRGELIQQTQRKLSQIDVLIGGEDLLITNLTGHPSLIVTCSSEQVDGTGRPGVAKMTAAAYRESALLQAAELVQQMLPPTPERPPLEV